MSYCTYALALPEDNVHRIYHDHHYGFEIESDNELFGRLILEINQAGLSWDTILKKQDNFRAAFKDFDIETIAAFTQKDIDILLQNAGIIRNKLKINAVIFNANKVLELQKEAGSFKKWLENQGDLELEDWIKLFKKNFKFTGKEITNEFLMSTGYLGGSHDSDCPTYKKLKKK